MFERPIGFVPLSGAAGLAALGGMRPTQFVPDVRFQGSGDATGDPAGGPGPCARPDAWQTGYADGLAEARADVAAEGQASVAASQALDQALARVDDEQATILAERLRETVLALCCSVIDRAAIDSSSLGARIEAAIAILRRTDEERLLRVHPDDLELIAGSLPQDLAIEPDPSLERGAIRIETATGGVESGPRQWRDAITAAVRGC